ncbi:snapalysin [Embleya sp. MST-111070]|uniref:snapalysin n=1 Tax=Embleya sp. MST-111070 TaxID=3398231 RepID=UPI003F73FEC3
MNRPNRSSFPSHPSDQSHPSRPERPRHAGRRRTVFSAALGLGLAAVLTAVPTSASASPSASHHPVPSHHTASAYAGSAADQAGNKAFFDAVMRSVRAKQSANPGLLSVTITYDASQAPSFASEIAQSAQIWNNAVGNVQLSEGGGGGADFAYYEGSDPQGFYADTDGHGHGYIFLDYQQNQEYYSVRVAAHETGHVLGLPDNYSGPCSELMSGGGPGPSCTNTQPDAQERSDVEYLWENGLAANSPVFKRVH